jgi:hypothetical protein
LKSQKDAFLTEAKTIFRKSSEKFGSELVKNNKVNVISSDGKITLDLGNPDLKYCVNLTNEGNVVDIKVTNGVYYVEGKSSFLDDGKYETVKYGDFNSKFNCSYIFSDDDTLPEPSLKDIRGDERYLNAVKIIGIAFVITVILGLIVRARNK